MIRNAALVLLPLFVALPPVQATPPADVVYEVVLTGMT
jgi:hypothetical protein